MTTVLVSYKVSPRRIADLMVSAIEGGSNYWLRGGGIYLESPGDVAPDDTHDGPWYDNPRRYEDPDLCLKVVEDDDGAETDHLVRQADITRGLQLMAEKSPDHFADIINENDDAITADVFLQYVTFGEIVYG